MNSNAVKRPRIQRIYSSLSIFSVLLYACECVCAAYEWMCIQVNDGAGEWVAWLFDNSISHEWIVHCSWLIQRSVRATAETTKVAAENSNNNSSSREQNTSYIDQAPSSEPRFSDRQRHSRVASEKYFAAFQASFSYSTVYEHDWDVSYLFTAVFIVSIRTGWENRTRSVHTNDQIKEVQWKKECDRRFASAVFRI